MTSSDPPRENSAKQSPPIPVDPASTTLWTAHAATAASMAFPPLCRISTAVRVAAPWDVAAIPFLPTATDLPGCSKFRMVLHLALPRAHSGERAVAPQRGLAYGDCRKRTRAR